MVPEKNCFTAEENMVYEEWQELTIVYVGSELHFYYDGIFVESHSVEGSGNYLEYDGNILIGKGTDGNMGNLFFPGNFDNLRIWQQALSQSEILSYLNSGMPTGDEEGLAIIKSPHLVDFCKDRAEIKFKGTQNIHTMILNVPAYKNLFKDPSLSIAKTVLVIATNFNVL